MTRSLREINQACHGCQEAIDPNLPTTCLLIYYNSLRRPVARMVPPDTVICRRQGRTVNRYGWCADHTDKDRPSEDP